MATTVHYHYEKSRVTACRWNKTEAMKLSRDFNAVTCTECLHSELYESSYEAYKHGRRVQLEYDKKTYED